LPVRIARISREPVGTEQKEKPIVHCERQSKSLVLNSTNYDRIAQATGESDYDKWPGRVVELFATETSFGGKTVPCVGVREHRKPAAAPALPPADDTPDDVPFDI
jgi:hypothetical protein